MNETRRAEVGDVFQISPEYGRPGWVGAFVLCTEVKPFGIQGYTAMIKTHEVQQRAYIRLKWRDVEFVGRAPFVPADEAALTLIREGERLLAESGE